VPAWRNQFYGRSMYNVLLHDRYNYVNETTLHAEMHAYVHDSWKDQYNRTYNIDRDTAEILKNLSSQLDPGSYQPNLCGAVLLPTIDYDPFEILVPCDKMFHKAFIICTEFISESTHEQMLHEYTNFSIKVMLNGSVIQGFTFCSDGWIPYQNRCIKVVQLQPHAHIQKVPYICHKHNASLLNLHLIHHLNSHGDLDIFLELYVKDRERIYWAERISQSQFIPKVHDHFDLRLNEWIVREINYSPPDTMDPRNIVQNALCEKLPDIVYLTSCGRFQFVCDNGMCISDLARCNGKFDCTNNEDELNCPAACYVNGVAKFAMECTVELCAVNECHCSSYYFKCLAGSCIPYSKVCNQIHDCPDRSDERDCPASLPSETEKDLHSCGSGKFVSNFLVNDLVSDCPNGEDEWEHVTLLDLRRRGHIYYGNICKDNNQIPCIWGHSKCLPSTKICVYDHLNNGDLRYCRNGIHLQNCMIAACQGMFKCPNTLCVPMHKVCNGVKDCPLGEDEEVCTSPLLCPGMLKCHPGICVTQEYICDSVSQCVNNDDEMFCDVTDCPHNCTCIGDLFNCTTAGLVVLPDGRGVKLLDASYNQITLESENFRTYNILKVLLLGHNALTSLPSGNQSSFKALKYLYHLSLDSNYINILPQGAFAGLVNLRSMSLHGNPLHSILDFAFKDCSNLLSLDLSHLGIKIISNLAFKGLESLQKIDISNNKLSSFDIHTLGMTKSIAWINIRKLFKHPWAFSKIKRADTIWMKVDFISSDDWRLCCLAESVKTCHVPQDELSTCKNLLSSQTQTVCLWITASCSFIANIFVLVYRIISSRKSPHSNNLFLIHLACSDILMSMYLFNLAIVDVQFRDKFLIYAMSWRSGWHCQVLSILSSLSLEMSMAIICLLSTFYLMAVTGKAKHLFTPFRKHILCFTLWIVFGFLSSGPSIGRVPITSNSCILFNFGKYVFSSWEYKVPLLFCVNSLLTAMTFGLCTKSIHVIYQSQLQVRQVGHVSGKSKHGSAYRNLVFLFVSNLVTWIPVEMLLVISLCRVSISPEVTNWFAIFVLPITSLSNPILYTIRNIISEYIRNYQKKKETKKQGSLITNSRCGKIDERNSIRPYDIEPEEKQANQSSGSSG